MRLNEMFFAGSGDPPLPLATDSQISSRSRRLSTPDFLRLWLIGLTVFSVRWLEMIVVGVFVYQRCRLGVQSR